MNLIRSQNMTLSHITLMLALAVCSAAGAEKSEVTAKQFRTPEEAVAALKSATQSADSNALRTVLGPAAEDLVNPDRIQAMTELKTFSSALAETNHLSRLSDTFIVLELGDDL